MRFTRFVLIGLAALLAAQAARSQAPTHGAETPGHGPHHSFGDVERAVERFEDPARAAWQKPDEVVAALHLAKGQTAADIGASTGYFARRLATAVGPTGRVWAVDIEPALVTYLKERAQREHLGNLEVRLATPDDPCLPAGGVDLVLIVNTLHHIENRAAYYPRVARALAPHGRFAVIDFLATSPVGPPPSERLAKAQVEKELQAAGFRIVEQPDFLPYQYFVIAQRP